MIIYSFSAISKIFSLKMEKFFVFTKITKDFVDANEQILQSLATKR